MININKNRLSNRLLLIEGLLQTPQNGEVKALSVSVP